MSKEEKKNVGALDDEAMGNVSGGKIRTNFDYDPWGPGRHKPARNPLAFAKIKSEINPIVRQNDVIAKWESKQKGEK